jgi:PAS domain S-box-containing protein
MNITPRNTSDRHRAAARVALLYVIVASLWIIASDRLLTLAASDPARIAWIGTAKGIGYVLVTTGLLYLLLRAWGGVPGRAADAQPPAKARGLVAAFLGLALTVPLLAYTVIRVESPRIERAAFADLTAIAQLKAGQIESWLAERRGDGEVLMANQGFVDAATRWLRGGDRDAQGAMPRVLKALQRAFGYRVELLDAQALGETREPMRRALLASALATGRVQMGELYRDGSGQVWMDTIAPLFEASEGGREAVGAVLLSAPAGEFLFPLLQTWPTPSASAETLLFRKEGSDVLFLNELRHSKNTALRLRLPLDSPALPAAIAARTGHRAQTIEGDDYRGVPVLAAVQPVSGTGWFLLAKVDRDETLRPLRNLVAWVGSVSLLAVAVVAAAVIGLWRQQQRAHRLELLAQAGERDRLLRLFYDLPFIGMAIAAPTTQRWLRVNDRLCEILGYPHEALLATPWDRLTHPDDRAAERIELDRLLAGESDGYTLEMRFLRQDAGVVEAAVKVQCVRGEDGEVEYLVMTVQDIGDRKAFERALLERVRLQDQLAKVAASVPGVICSFRQEPDGSVTMPYASPAAEALFGFGPEALAADFAPVMARIRPEDIVHVQASIAESARSMAPWRDEYRYRHPGRGEIWVEGHSVPLREEDGGILWHGYVQDISERKAAEEALREREEDLNRAQAVGHIGSWRLDLRRNVLTWSAENHRIFGVPRGTPMTYETFMSRVHPDDRDYVDRMWKASLRGAPYDIEHRLVVAGEVKWVREKAELELDEDGVPLSGFGTTQDITDIKRAEEALREADRRKDEFLAMLAHELRNPLVPIRNAAHVLGRLDLDEPRVRWAHGVIERQVSHLARLVDDLLDVSRIARGKIALKREAVDLANLVERALESVRPFMQAKGHRLEAHTPEQAVQLLGDPVRLGQVLVNLLENAAKYTPDGGHIALRAEVTGTNVAIRISDDGMGMAPELLPVVFDLFQQGERALDRTQGGLGIGLTLVKGLVEMHGGQVTAQSSGPGRGSTFTVSLPLAVEATPEPAAATPPTAAPAPVRVLLVEDDPAVAESTATLLEIEGHQVRTADSGDAALEAMAELRPQCVLLDIGLPGEDGYQVARRIRGLPEGEKVRLVAVSGYGHEEAVARSREAGFDDHLVKPVDPGVLSRLLSEVAAAPSS